jgi:ATP-dependent exoDNAse (exonuclease V) beta subunit
MTDDRLFAVDADARRRALDTGSSFIVRAPAGSGKTELLIQRVLALLATVDAPEEVVAITFTRKAAAEMRQRVVVALEVAKGPEPGPPHEQLTWSLAGEVNRRDAERGWDIVHNPGRLRVQTIDALAQWLARQLPLSLGLGAVPNVKERAADLYARAARAALAVLESGDPEDEPLARHVARLLEHLDNDVGRAIRLIASMLGRRDQWLRHLGGRERDELEAALQRACEKQMRLVSKLLPAPLADDLLELVRYAAGNAEWLAPCRDLDGLPRAEMTGLDAWCSIASLLLTKGGTWRGRFTVAEGFPAGATKQEKERAKAYKERIHRLIEQLGNDDALRVALDELRSLPPARYSDAQWGIAGAIVEVLRRAAAELAVVFAEAGAMDFTEVTRRAVRALGDELGSDIALALDARVRHLLIDEFQDTSITQFELIERLVADWSSGDGRTLFIVGDPMQSIYRFREAEVGLFLRAWERGVGPLVLEPLRLTRNFRSQKAVVEWVNDAFARVLPRESDITSGAVSFEPAAAVHGHSLDAAVQVHAFVGGGAGDEAKRVVEVVEATRAESPQASIALLVRARSHLVEIAAELRRAGLRPTAVELHSLANQPLISDLVALTRALEHLADRTAWLSVLRAPWCGLTLADLTSLAEGDTRPVVELLEDDARLRRLSADGRSRVARVGPVLQRAVELADRMPGADRVEQAWLLLGGPACLSSESERADAEQFFAHLFAHEDENGGRIEVNALQESLASLFAAPEAGSDPAFQVMTIHKAKGLEFDHVIVPRLGVKPRGDDAQLMVWLERAAEEGPELLLAPIHAGGSDKDRLLRWVESQLQQRQRHEDERLAYVAATRARHRLHWIGSASKDDDGRWTFPPTSLLARLWPVLQPGFEAGRVIDRGAGMLPADQLPDQTLRRLPLGWTLPALPPTLRWSAVDGPSESGGAIEFSWAGETARRVGVVVHRWLQRMAEDTLDGWDAARVRVLAPHIERELAAGGLTGKELAAARDRVSQALLNAVQGERGRWVLGRHPDHRSELRLSVVEGGRVRKLVLDRTFVAQDGTRWIVDYKVGAHEGTDVEAFLDSEQVRYQGQLERYGAALDPLARLGLYFPLVPGWREWSMASGSPEETPGKSEGR